MDDRPLRKKIKYGSIYWALRFLIFLSGTVPRTWWLAFFGWLGKMAYSIPSKYKNDTILHLGLALGKEKSTKEIVALSKQVYILIGKNAGDIIRSQRVRTLKQLDRFVITNGMDNYERALAKGKGLIFLTGHFGAFELMITAMGLRKANLKIVGTALQDPRLNELIRQIRSTHGTEAIERGKETFSLLKALKSGHAIALLIDQDTKVKSRFVNFFGMPASTPIGATVLAMKTGAAVIPAYIFLGEDNKQHMYLDPEVALVNTGDEEKDIVTNTQILTTEIERIIRKNPAQWVWMHERWKTKPGEEIR